VDLNPTKCNFYYGQHTQYFQSYLVLAYSKELRGQELQERVEIAGQLLRGVRPGGLSGR
jgi:hypothetical protein